MKCKDCKHLRILKYNIYNILSPLIYSTKDYCKNNYKDLEHIWECPDYRPKVSKRKMKAKIPDNEKYIKRIKKRRKGQQKCPDCYGKNKEINPLCKTCMGGGIILPSHELYKGNAF